MGYGVAKKTWAALAILTIVGATLFSQDLPADGTTASNCTGSSGQNQLGQYCGSSQSAQDGSNANSALWKVWGGVAAVCLNACFSNATTMGLGTTACKTDSTAGSATNAVVTKNYTTSLTSIASTQGGSALTKVGSSTSSAAAQTNPCSSDDQQCNANFAASEAAQKQAAADQKKAQAKKEACAAGAQAAATSITNFRSMSTNDQVAQQAATSAEQLNSNSNGALSQGSGGAHSAPGAPQASSIGGGNVGQTSAATAGGIASTCSSARQTNQTQATIQCAVANDSSLPAFVASPQFPQAFQQASGTDFSNFGNQAGQSPSDAIAQAASGGLSTSDATKLATVLKSMEGTLYAEAAPYASNGGGAAASAGGSDSNLDAEKLMAQMKEQMGLGGDAKAANETKSGVEAVIFANQTRSPASVAEDKTLSIFDRVTYRYYFVMKQRNMGDDR